MDSNMGVGVGLIFPDSELKRLRGIMYDVATDAYKQAGNSQKFGDYLNKSEAANYLGVSKGTLNQFIQAGLPVITVSNIQRISKKACDAFYTEHQI